MIHYDQTVLTHLLTSLSIFIESNITVYEADGHEGGAKGVADVRFCHFINENYQKRCAYSDRCALERLRKNDAFYYHCHFGLIEMLMKFPLCKDRYVAVMIGPFRDKTNAKKDAERIREYATLFRQNEKELLAEYRKIPVFSEEKFTAIKSLITAIMEFGRMTKLISSKENFIDEVLDPYIETHQKDKLSIARLSKTLGLTAKQLERIVRLYSGQSPKRYIVAKKMDAAADDIVNTSMPLTDIAAGYGFYDYNYFVKVFKSFKGETPSKMRKTGRSNG